jgi:tripartite-type tricarboxylate transporter receptor subunit TctC
MRSAFARLVLEPHAANPGAFAAMVRADLDRWAGIAKSLNYQRVDAS